MAIFNRVSNLSAAVAAAGVLTMAAARGDDSSPIHSCVHKSNGHVRIVPAGEVCTNAESPLDWNAQGPIGPAGPQGPQGPAGQAAPRLFARLDAQGNILAASPTVVADGTGKFTNLLGQYEVRFDRPVRTGCVVVASVHDPRTNILDPPPPGYATTWFTSQIQVGITTFGADGSPADMSFDVIVLC